MLSNHSVYSISRDYRPLHPLLDFIIALLTSLSAPNWLSPEEKPNMQTDQGAPGTFRVFSKLGNWEMPATWTWTWTWTFFASKCSCRRACNHRIKCYKLQFVVLPMTGYYLTAFRESFYGFPAFEAV